MDGLAAPGPRSRLARELRSHRPDGEPIPEILDRAWEWLEQHPPAWDIEFTASLSLSRWFDAAVSDRLLPFAVVGADGSIAALWRDDDAVRIVCLESEGDGYVLADDAAAFVRLLAIGYDELTRYELGLPPADDAVVAAAAEYRAWVRDDLGLEVPSEWPVVGDDDFSAWLDVQRGRGRVAPADSAPEVDTHVEGDAVGLISLLGRPDDSAAAEELGSILEAPLKSTLRSSSRELRGAGVEVESDRHGIQTIWITLGAYPHPDRLVVGLTLASTREDAIACLGAPERQGEAWVRFAVLGRYLHLEFESGMLARVTLMTDAP